MQILGLEVFIFRQFFKDSFFEKAILKFHYLEKYLNLFLQNSLGKYLLLRLYTHRLSGV